MTIGEALRILTEPAAAARISALAATFRSVSLVPSFQTALLNALEDSPIIRAALQVFWDHYNTMLEEASIIYKAPPPGEEAQN